jgi:hypothetical protein
MVLRISGREGQTRVNIIRIRPAASLHNEVVCGYLLCGTNDPIQLQGCFRVVWMNTDDQDDLASDSTPLKSPSDNRDKRK